MLQAIIRALVQFGFWVGTPTLALYSMARWVEVPGLIPTLVGVFGGMVMFVAMVERRWVNQ